MPKFAKILAMVIPIGGFAMQVHAEDIDASAFTELTAVHVTGKGSRTVIVTDSTRAPSVSVRKDGGNGVLCSRHAGFSQEDGVLTVDVRNRGISLGVRCDITIELVMPQAVAVTFDQPQAAIEMNGMFTDIDINVSKMTVTFDGQAATFNMNGDMGVVDAVFSKIGDEAPQIDINVAKLVANVGYPAGAGLDYHVSAPVSMFSKRYPQTPGAAGKLRVTSNLLKGSVYAAASQN